MDEEGKFIRAAIKEMQDEIRADRGTLVAATEKVDLALRRVQEMMDAGKETYGLSRTDD
jgi:hypothetical protein